MGVSRERLVDPINLASNLICSICLEVLDNPYSVCLEDHVFCKKCCDDFAENQNLSQHQADMAGTAFKSFDCPNCKCIRDYHRRNYRPAKFVGRIVGSLLVYCENREFGCKWSGELSNHQGHLSSCSRRMIGCPNHCGETFRANKLRNHKLKECEDQMLVCPRGGSDCLFMRCEKAEHAEECEFWKCTVNEKCPTSGTLAMLRSHEPYCLELHNSLERAQSAAGLTNLEKEFEELEEYKDDLEYEVDKLENLIVERNSKIEELEDELDELKEFDEDDLDKEEFIENLYEALAIQAESLEKTDRRVAIRDEKIAALEKEIIELKPKLTLEEEIKMEIKEEALFESIHPAFGIITGVKRRLDQMDTPSPPPSSLEIKSDTVGAVTIGSSSGSSSEDSEVTVTDSSSNTNHATGYRFLKMMRLG